MPKAQKLPVEVEFWDIEYLLGTKVIDWPVGLLKAYDANIIRKFPSFLEIKTLEGWMKGTRDWILIKGIHGEFYPCKKDIFRKSYRILDEECSEV